MHRLRLTYIPFVFATIIAGLLSRHFTAVPLFIGDILWALMVYFIARFIFSVKSLQFSIVISLLFSYAIEFSQLYQATWINSLRNTWLGHMVLGVGFLWSDLLCYTAGIAIGVLLDKKFLAG